MYEESNPFIRRIILLAIGAIVIIAVLWLLVWLIFFRHSNTAKVAPKTKPNSSQGQVSENHPSTPPSNNSSQNQAQANTQGTVSAPGTSSTTTPKQLANTGPGNVFVPIVVATAVGTLVYQLRLRRLRPER